MVQPDLNRDSGGLANRGNPDHRFAGKVQHDIGEGRPPVSLDRPLYDPVDSTDAGLQRQEFIQVVTIQAPGHNGLALRPDPAGL